MNKRQNEIRKFFDQAAEKYNVNIPSLTSLKEEQELLIENLLKDSNWYWSKPILREMTPLLNLTQIHPPLFKMKNDSILSNKFDKSNKKSFG